MKNNLSLLLVLSVFFLGCGRNDVPMWEKNSLNFVYNKLSEIDPDKLYMDPNSYRVIVPRMLIYNANISLSVKQVDSTVVMISSIAKRYDGYAVESGTYKSVIRVKSESLNKAIEEITLLGKVQSKSISGNDVTEEYTDYSIRLENAEKARERYLELLKGAENVTAALLVEKELERLNGEIEMLEGSMHKIDHLTAYSTITVYISEKVKPGILGYIGIGIYEAVKWLFVRN